MQQNIQSPPADLPTCIKLAEKELSHAETRLMVAIDHLFSASRWHSEAIKMMKNGDEEAQLAVLHERLLKLSQGIKTASRTMGMVSSAEHLPQ